MKRYTITHMLVDGMEFSREEIEAATKPGAATSFVVERRFEQTPQQLAEWERMLKSLAGPILTQIDAPSTLVAELRAAIGREIRRHSEHWSLPVAVYNPDAVPLVVDNELPMRTVRYHFSDGTTRTEKLG